MIRAALLLLLALPGCEAADLLTGVVRHQRQAVVNAIVYLGVSPARSGVSNLPPVVVQMRRGVFEPHIQIGQLGAPVSLRNADPTLRVVSLDVLNTTNGPVRLTTEAMPFAGFEKTIAVERYREPMLLRAVAGNGGTATSYIALLPHTWAAVTDAAGTFAIATPPPGTHKLYLWHATLGTQAREVRITPGRPTSIEVEFPATP